MIIQISAKKQALEVTQEVVEEKNGLSPLQIGIIAGSVGIAIVIIIVLMVKKRPSPNCGYFNF